MALNAAAGGAPHRRLGDEADDVHAAACAWLELDADDRDDRREGEEAQPRLLAVRRDERDQRHERHDREPRRPGDREPLDDEVVQEQCDRHEVEPAAFEVVPEVNRVLAGDAADPLLDRLEVDHHPDAEEEDDRRDRRDDDDVGERRRRVLDHQEGGRPHHGREDLPAGRRGRLDGAGELRIVARPLHQRDRERAGRDRVGDRRPRDRSHEPAGEDARLRRAAFTIPGEPVREVDEPLAAPLISRNEPNRMKM